VREREDRETVLARKRGRGLWNFFLFAIFFFFLFARFFYAIFFFGLRVFFFTRLLVQQQCGVTQSSQSHPDQILYRFCYLVPLAEALAVQSIHIY
jgi:hypothetical protein